VAFGGRTLADDPAKYLNSPETPLFSKSRVLYGLSQAKSAIQAGRQAIIVEGYLDAVLLHQHGVQNVVATLGTALTDSHVKLLRPLADELVMCFDSDEAGIRAADRAVEVALKHRIEVRVLMLPDGEDPADLCNRAGGSEFKSLLPSALGALEFKWNRTNRAYLDRGPRARRDAAGAFLQFIAQTTAAGGVDPLEHGLLVGRVSELLRVPSAEVYEWLARYRTRGGRAATADAPGSSVPSDPVGSGQSDYDASLAGVPAGLISAVEEVFGLALAAPERWDRLDSSLAAACRHSAAWRRMYELIAALQAGADPWGRSDVQARCDDATLCELVGRAAERVSTLGVSDEGLEQACGRVSAELDALRFEALGSRVREGSAAHEQDAAFRSLLEVARRREGALGVRPQGAPV
jgi:DNA primase